MKKILSLCLGLLLLLTACASQGDPNYALGPQCDGPSLAAYFSQDVDTIELFHSHSSQQMRLITEQAQIDRIREWAASLEYEYKEYEKGNSPGDQNGGEVYMFTLTGEEAWEFSYINNGGNDCHLLIDGLWCAVSNPSDPPVQEIDGLEQNPFTASGGPGFLTVICGQKEIQVGYSNGSWDAVNADVTGTSWIACGAHPLNYKDLLKPFAVSESVATLQFEFSPDQITVQCWSDAHWGDVEAEPETISVEGGEIELKPGGYIYSVNATWTGQGRAEYVFYAVSGHDHQLAAEPNTVDDPYTGYCGNTVTTVWLDGKGYSFWGVDSVRLTDILINLDYDPAKLCDCPAEYTVDTEFGAGFGVNLTEGFARREQGQTELTSEQVEMIADIIAAMQRDLG